MSRDRRNWDQVPEKPICRNAQRTGPCKFAGVCSERRQRILGAVIQTPHGEVVREDLANRGKDCLWFEHLEELERARVIIAPPVVA